MGTSLQDHWNRSPLGFKRVALMVAHIADTVSAAHRAGIIYRRMNPANIHLDENDHVHVSELGLATIGNADEMSGALPYSSPEELSSDSCSVDFRTDVYSVGAILYEMLTDSTPFRGTTDEIIFQIIHDEPLGPRAINPAIPKDLETICLRAMAKEPDRRFQSAEDLRDDLLRFHRGEPIHSFATSIDV